MAHMKAGLAVVEALRAEGVDHIFGVVGWTINSIATELHGRSDIRLIDTRHEEGAAFMAYGYARASGRPAVCLTTAGAGATNLLTGMSLAYKGRAPVIAIAGDVARKHFGRDGHQSFDLVNPRFDKLAEVYGARGYYVTRPDEIADAVKAALALDGPSVIEFPVAEYFPPPAPRPGVRAAGH